MCRPKVLQGQLGFDWGRTEKVGKSRVLSYKELQLLFPGLSAEWEMEVEYASMATYYVLPDMSIYVEREWSHCWDVIVSKDGRVFHEELHWDSDGYGDLPEKELREIIWKFIELKSAR